MKKIMMWTVILLPFIACNSNEPSSGEKSEATATIAEAKEEASVEFADAKYAEIGKKGIAALSSGDVEGWLSGFADNAVYIWNNGDSIAGKPAIMEYWKKRRSEVIDSINYVNDIWLALKVNKPQQKVQAPGIWLLSWYMVDVKYKGGKQMKQWIHTDMHFDANDKIDRAIQYIDRAPINAAMKK